MPAAGFGFGDAVIVELLSDRGLLPPDEGPGVTAVVFAFDSELQVRGSVVSGNAGFAMSKGRDCGCLAYARGCCRSPCDRFTLLSVFWCCYEIDSQWMTHGNSK